MKQNDRTLSPLLQGLFLFLIACAVYIPIHCAQLIPETDDDMYLINNTLLSGPGGLAKIWLSPFENIQYYPVTFTVFWLEHRLWGLDPLGYHAGNVFFHALTALLAWLCLRRLGARWPWFAAAVFAVHPVHAASVAYTSELKNVLSGTFFLGAVLSYLRYLDERAKRWYWACFGLFLLSLLSKTIACTLPLVLLLLRWYLKRPTGWRDAANLAPFFAAALAYGLVTIAVENAAEPIFAASAAERLIRASRALLFYIGKLAWPARLAFNYERWRIDPGDPFQWLWVVAAVAGLAMAWRLSRRLGRGVSAGVVFYLITILPMLGFFNAFMFLFSYVADHWQYLPSLGLIALAAAGLSRIPVPRLREACAVVILLALGFKTWNRADAFGSRVKLLQDTLRNCPDSFSAHWSYGEVLENEGKLAEALAHFQAALRLNPDATIMNFHLASVLEKQGRVAEAEAQYRESLRANPRYTASHHLGAHIGLGRVLDRLGRAEAAIVEYGKAVEVGSAMAARTQGDVRRFYAEDLDGARKTLAAALERQEAVNTAKAAEIISRGAGKPPRARLERPR